MAESDKLIDSVLTHQPGSNEFTNAVATLASLSREEEHVRNQLASKDVFNRLLDTLSSHPKNVNAEDFLATVLRCVGNACVSNTKACQMVTEFKFGWCKAFLKGFPCQWSASAGNEDAASETTNGQYDDSACIPFPMPSVSTRDLAIKVLYNICSQSEEAQKQCYHDDIHTLVIEAMFDNQHFGEHASSEMLSLTADLLLWITSHHKELASFEGETERKHGLARNKALKTDALYWLIKAPLSYVGILDVDDWASLLETCLVFLRDPLSHNDIISWELFHVVWYVLESNERKIQEVCGDSEDDQKLLVALSTSLTWVLSDVAATPQFAAAYANSTANALALMVGTEIHVLQQLVEDLSLLLHSGKVYPHDASGDKNSSSVDDKSLRLTTAACQVIGNLLHGLIPIGGKIPTAIQTQQIYEHLFSLMAASDNADFLHSAAGLLIQLSRSSVEVREEIASEPSALPAIKRLGQHVMQELNQDALKLMRALGKGAPTVQGKFKEVAGEIMAAVAETQKATADAQSSQPLLQGTN